MLMVFVSCREANALNVANCTAEKKRELFTIAKQAFVTSTRSGTVSVPNYQLTQPYLGMLTHTAQLQTCFDLI